MPDRYRSVQVAADADRAALSVAGTASVPVWLGTALAVPEARVPWLAGRDLLAVRDPVESAVPGVTDAPHPVTASARVTSGIPVRRAVQRWLLACCRTRIVMLLLPAWTSRGYRALRRLPSRRARLAASITPYVIGHLFASWHSTSESAKPAPANRRCPRRPDARASLVGRFVTREEAAVVAASELPEERETHLTVGIVLIGVRQPPQRQPQANRIATPAQHRCPGRIPSG